MTVPTSTPRPGSLEHWASVKPDEVAVFEGDRSLTWSQWNDASNRVAQALVECGVVAGDIVAISCHIRIEWAVLNGALAKLGCFLIGMNWRLTAAEVHDVLSSGRVAAFICDTPDPADFLEVLKPLSLKLIASIDARSAEFRSWAELLAAHPVARNSAVEARAISYTSGTTGLPKGVLTPVATTPDEMQRKKEYWDEVQEVWGRREGDVTLVTMPFSGVGRVLAHQSIAAGIPMVFQRRYEPEQVLQLIEKHRITLWLAVPTMLKRLASLPAPVFRKYDVSSLRVVMTGAAPVPQPLKAWFGDVFGTNVLAESYGSSEIGMISTLSAKMMLERPGSSGRLHKHVKIKVCDQDGRELPRGEIGEFWVNTPNTIQNYLNSPPLDRSTLDEEGFFRSGDMGHVDEEGYVYITDRAKDMIIRGGQNIFPAEIEAVLLQHPSVQDAAVIGIPDDEFGEQVKAFVEPKPGHIATPAALLDFASGKLAFYKRPKSVEIVAELPRNANGKLLKRELRAPYWVGRERHV